MLKPAFTIVCPPELVLAVLAWSATAWLISRIPDATKIPCMSSLLDFSITRFEAVTAEEGVTHGVNTIVENKGLYVPEFAGVALSKRFGRISLKLEDKLSAILFVSGNWKAKMRFISW